jgi:hypothetical protein
MRALSEVRDNETRRDYVSRCEVEGRRRVGGREEAMRGDRGYVQARTAFTKPTVGFDISLLSIVGKQTPVIEPMIVALRVVVVRNSTHRRRMNRSLRGR